MAVLVPRSVTLPPIPPSLKEVPGLVAFLDLLEQAIQQGYQAQIQLINQALAAQTATVTKT